MDIVIITQNLSADLLETLLSVDYYKPIIVCDRCTDDSVSIASKYGKVIDTSTLKWEGRKTSSSRNLGLLATKSDVLFLDGDRAVIGDLRTLEDAKTDIVLLKLELDNRPNNAEEMYGKYYNGFYSCGIFFKREAINKIIAEYGELFPTWIEYCWGLEDITLGDICYDLGLTLSYSKDIKLKGCFTRFQIDDIHYLLDRLRLRALLKTKEKCN